MTRLYGVEFNRKGEVSLAHYDATENETAYFFNKHGQPHRADKAHLTASGYARTAREAVLIFRDRTEAWLEVSKQALIDNERLYAAALELVEEYGDD